MLHSTQVMLIRRLLGLLERGTTDMDPEPVQQPVDVYTSSERLERERMLLQRVPIMLESTARLRKPGDFVTHDALGIPLLLCVDKAGDIRAFINVCRHRGARLVEDDSGVSRHVFVCPYHGWAYAGDGRLSHIPHAYGFAEGHCDKTRLAPFPVTVRHGFVWTAPGPDVDHHLGRLAAEIAGWGIDGQHPAYQLEMSADANWKLLIEGGFETYHFRRVHAGTVYPVVYDNVAPAGRFPSPPAADRSQAQHRGARAARRGPVEPPVRGERRVSHFPEHDSAGARCIRRAALIVPGWCASQPLAHVRDVPAASADGKRPAAHG